MTETATYSPQQQQLKDKDNDMLLVQPNTICVHCDFVYLLILATTIIP